MRDKLGVVGMMMECKIEDCFIEIRNGANIKQGIVEGGYPITRIETLADDRFNRDRMGYAGIDVIDKYADYVLQDGDLLMSHINSPKYLGRTVAYHKKPDEIIIHGMNLLKLKANTNIVLPDYIQFLFASYGFKGQIAKIMKKSVNQASFSINDLKKIMINIPPLEVQQEIVDRIKKIQEILGGRTKQIGLLEQIVKSQFVKMFGVPLINNMQWDELKAGEVCGKITDGSHFSPKDCADSRIPMLSVKDMSNEGFSYDKCKHVSREDYDSLNRNGCKPQKGDVLIAKDGSYFYYGFVLEREIEQVILSSIAILRPNYKYIDSYYLRYYMMSKEIVNLVGNQYVSGAALKRVILKGIREIPVMLPPLDLQNKFASFVKQVDKEKVVIQKSLDETQILFDSLMQKYFG